MRDREDSSNSSSRENSNMAVYLHANDRDAAAKMWQPWYMGGEHSTMQCNLVLCTY